MRRNPTLTLKRVVALGWKVIKNTQNFIGRHFETLNSITPQLEKFSQSLKDRNTKVDGTRFKT